MGSQFSKSTEPPYHAQVWEYPFPPGVHIPAMKDYLSFMATFGVTMWLYMAGFTAKKVYITISNFITVHFIY